MRRDSSDKRWIEVKKRVKLRDKDMCRLCCALDAQEFKQLKKNAGMYLYLLDAAHYLAVSDRPDLCYSSANIVLLNHYSHSLLDSFKHPITGVPITKEENLEWWKRILKTNQIQYDFLVSKGLIPEGEINE